MDKKNLATQRLVVRTVLSFCFVGILFSSALSQKILAHKKLGALPDSKISSSLKNVITQLRADRDITLAKKAARFSASVVRIDNIGNIQSYIHMQAIRPQYVESLRQLGAVVEIVNAQWNVVQAWLPYDKFEDAAELNFVKWIAPPDYAIHMTGSVNSEGDGVLRADDVRNTLGIDGTGVRVGVISDGVDHLADAQSTNDLPANIEINPNLAGSGDEGTAMLEIVHDLAPGAQLAFSGAQTSLEMIDAIEYLANSAFGGAGCQIIVDDLGFLTQPSFQDGSIAKKVEEVVAQGVTYFTAVGNQAREHYEMDFIEGSRNFQGQQLTVHDFGLAAGGGSDLDMDVDVNPGGELTVILQWNDPFPGSGNDYDLLLIHDVADTLLAISQDTQNGTQFPVEVASFTNNLSTTIPVDVVLRSINASTRLVELFLIGKEFSVNEHNIEDGSVVPGQQSAAGAISVGAIFVLDPGHNTLESFSSRGPVRIFFPAAEVRTKPDIAATDGNLITGAGGFGSKFGDDFRFFGTSSAAPHAAAVAALVLSANQSLSPAQVREALSNSAVDLGDNGVDNAFGAGRIDAFETGQSVVTSVAEPGTTLPEDYVLGQNYPNPFNPGTLIRYSLPQSHKNAPVKLEVFNALGQKVRTLVQTTQSAGNYSVEWDGLSDSGSPVATGVYLYRLQAGSFVDMKKMILLR